MKIRLYLLQIICTGSKQNHLFGVEEEISVADYYNFIITLVICFKLNFFDSLSPWPFPASFYWRDKMAFPRDRMAKGQKGGTERLGQKGRDRTSRILTLFAINN